MLPDADKIRRWKSCVSTIVNQRSRMVHVSFTHAPPAYGFADYWVSLNYINHRNTKRNRTNMTSWDYPDVGYGTYKILVFPDDPNNMCGGTCHRRRSDPFTVAKNGRHLVNLTVCGNNTRTRVETPLEMAAKSSTITTEWKLYLLLLPLLLFVIIACVLYKWKRSRTNGNESNISNLTTSTSSTATTATTTTTPSGSKVKVFVLYTDDHLFHTEACLSFIHYLNEHCFCDVLNAYPEYSSVPAYNMDKYSDFVLVINSQGFHKGFSAWQKCSGSDMIVKSHTCPELYEKILQNCNRSPSAGVCEYLMCAMDYTDNKFIPVELRKPELFRIINDMTDLVCYMQNLNLNTINENDIPRVFEHIQTSPDGKALITAIENAENYEMTHPNCCQ